MEGEGLGSGAPNVEQRRSPVPAGGGSARELGRRVLAVESNSVLVATVALIAFIGVVHPDFLSWGQLKEVVQNSVYVGVIAAGMAFLISMREIDLSVGSMFGLALVGSALLIKRWLTCCPSPGARFSTATTSSKASICIRRSGLSLACCRRTRTQATSGRWRGLRA